MKNWVAFTLLLLASPLVVAKQTVYFWYDENGVIHFAEQRPSNRQVYAVDLATPKAVKTESKKYTYDSLFAEDEQQKQAQTEQEKLAKQQQYDASACDRAQKNRWILANRQRVRLEDDNGEQRMLSHEEKQELIKENDEMINTFCGQQTLDSEAGADQAPVVY